MVPSPVSSQPGCRVEEFSCFARHQGGFVSAGRPRRVRDTLGSTLLEQSGSLLLSSKALPTPGPSPACPGMLRGAGERRGRRRPGAAAAASVRRFHLEGAPRNCTRGPARPSPRLRLYEKGFKFQGLSKVASSSGSRHGADLFHLPVSAYPELLSLITTTIFLCFAQSCLSFLQHQCWKEEEFQTCFNISNQCFHDHLCYMVLLGFMY